MTYEPARSAEEAWEREEVDCRECFEARQFPPPQEHFGWTLWRTCGHGCAHGHHDGEVWLG